ncbi:hypothetical protein [Streptococcus gallolyticus]|uniref:hypothetical protein n=1 Tax=Streptococcus gallolyticus TaxID=315405 RepID=UPI002F9522C4
MGKSQSFSSPSSCERDPVRLFLSALDTLGSTPDTGYCIHALNTAYLDSLGKWLRLDARGNKKNVHAEFSLDEEKLAFYPNAEGEIDYHDNHANPDQGLMTVLEHSTDAIDMYLHHLPDSLSNDIKELK